MISHRESQKMQCDTKWSHSCTHATRPIQMQHFFDRKGLLPLQLCFTCTNIRSATLQYLELDMSPVHVADLPLLLPLPLLLANSCAQ
jgi:hypothetical protein|eukprot:COSAG02_NODE_2536_length_8579_cov_4.816863_10_plen_87_part_00